MVEWQQRSSGPWWINDVHQNVINEKVNLSLKYSWVAGGSNSNNSGYVSQISTIDRINYANDLVTVPKIANLAVSGFEISGMNNAEKGYFAIGISGNLPNTSAMRSFINRIIFANDSADAVRTSNLSPSRDATGSVSNGTDKGYIFGGSANDVTSAISRLQFTDDSSVAVKAANMAQGAAYVTATRSSTHGYASGGRILSGSTGAYLSRSQRLIFATDTVAASFRGNLTANLAFGQGYGNNEYSWFSGGLSGDASMSVSNTQRMSFASDTSNSVARGFLSSPRSHGSASGNNTNTWIQGGGISQNSIRDAVLITAITVEMVSMPNDTATATARGNLLVARYGQGAV